MPQSPTDDPGQYPTSTLLIGGGLVLVLVAGFVVLTATGRDPSSYMLLLGSPLVTGVVGAVLSKRVGKVEAIARTVEKQTNGQLSRNLETIHGHLDAQTQEIVDEVRQILPAPPNPPAAATRQVGRTLPGMRQPADNEAQVLGPIRPSTLRP